MLRFAMARLHRTPSFAGPGQESSGARAALRVSPERAIALEDPPNGVRAARGAGLFCIAVPGPMTQDLSFEGADLVPDSLGQTSLDEVLLRRAAAR
jgi:beta-phosphoglucomutase-like phosphatase (HAD superfamily)